MLFASQTKKTWNLQTTNKNSAHTLEDLSSSFGISSTDIGSGFSRDFRFVCAAGRASTSTRFGALEAHATPRPATLTTAVLRTIGGASDRPALLPAAAQ